MLLKWHIFLFQLRGKSIFSTFPANKFYNIKLLDVNCGRTTLLVENVGPAAAESFNNFSCCQNSILCPIWGPCFSLAWPRREDKIQRWERDTQMAQFFLFRKRAQTERESERERERERVQWRKTIKWRIRNFFPSFRESWVVQLHSASSLFLSLSYPPILSFTLRPFLSISSLHISASFFCLLTSVFFLLSSIFCLLSSVFYLLSSFYLSLSLSYIHPIYLHTVYFDLSIYIFAFIVLDTSLTSKLFQPNQIQRTEREREWEIGYICVCVHRKTQRECV